MARLCCNVISYILKRTVDITVIIPTPTFPEIMEGDCTHTPKERYPVVYLLHGMGNNHATWGAYSNIELFAEERQIAVACISGENQAYLESGSGDFFRFLSEELPDLVCGLFPVSRKREDTYIAGLSMGGFGALVHAFSFPEHFAAVGAFSAGSRVWVRGSEFDPFVLAGKIAKQGKAFPDIYLACGQGDSFYNRDIELRDGLAGLGANVTWDELTAYGHEWRFWNIEIERFLDWLPRADYYSGREKRKV